jgi:hypothetical protein
MNLTEEEQKLGSIVKWFTANEGLERLEKEADLEPNFAYHLEVFKRGAGCVSKKTVINNTVL